MRLSKMQEELYVMQFILELHENVIDEKDETTISSEIEKKMLEIPLADSWINYLLVKEDEANTKLQRMIRLVLQNLLQVIDEKYQEELEKTRPSFDKKVDRNPKRRYLRN